MSEVHASAEMIEAAMAAGEASVTGAPESHAEAPEVAGVPQGTEVDYKAAYNDLMATFTDYRVNTIRVATAYGERYGGCWVVDQAIAEIDPTMKRVTFGASASITVKLTVSQVDSRHEVTDSALWEMIGDLVNALVDAEGDIDATSYAQAHSIEIVEQFEKVDLSVGKSVPEYVSPRQWEADRLARLAAEREAMQRRQTEAAHALADDEGNAF